MVARWLKIDATLSPIIGRGGVAALYHRGLHVTGRKFPWISRLRADEDLKMDLTLLESELEKQPDETAEQAAAEFLATFHGLLAGLIGLSLSERILGDADSFLHGSAKAEDLNP